MFKKIMTVIILLSSIKALAVEQNFNEDHGKREIRTVLDLFNKYQNFSDEDLNSLMIQSSEFSPDQKFKKLGKEKLIFIGETHTDFTARLVQLVFLKRNLKQDDILLTEGHSGTDKYAFTTKFFSVVAAMHYKGQIYDPVRHDEYRGQLLDMVLDAVGNDINNKNQLYYKLKDAGIITPRESFGWNSPNLLKKNQNFLWADMFVNLVPRNDSMLEAINNALKAKKKEARVFIVAGALHIYPFMGKSSERFGVLTKTQADELLSDATNLLSDNSLSSVYSFIENEVFSGSFNQGQSLKTMTNWQDIGNSLFGREFITSNIIQSQVKLYSFLSDKKHIILSYPEPKLLNL